MKLLLPKYIMDHYKVDRNITEYVQEQMFRI